MGTFLYAIIIAVMVYLVLCYFRIVCHFHSQVATALRTALHPHVGRPSTTDDSLSLSADELEARLRSGVRMRERALALDVRLSSYLAAYLLSQLPSVVHRLWQAASPDGYAPEWLAVAQSATQPAQGLLNLIVFSHHSRRPSTDRSSWAVLGCCC